MSDDRWQATERLFIEALALPVAARAAHVARACGGDAPLERDVLSLLEAAEHAERFLEQPALDRLGAAMAADGWSLSPGQRLGAYVVREMLGAGAVGEVWRASDERLARDVAIKVLLPHLSQDPERVRRFLAEARTAGSLNHPNVLSVHDVGTHASAPFIVSEYVEGESLRSRLKRGPLPIDAATTIAQQIARGLAAAHARGIVHRDLKPDNVFLRADGGVKILDFGLATLKATAAPAGALPTENTGLAGTAGYTAPEQIRGHEADVRSDLFALGVTLYEMLAGDRPFKGAGALETLHATLNQAPPDLRLVRNDLPPSLTAIVTRLLGKTPESRFQSADEVAEALDACRAPGSDGAFTRWSGVPRPALAAVVSIIVIIGTVSMLRTGEPDASGAAGGPQRPALAILDFVDKTGTSDDAWLASGMPILLFAGLGQTPGLHLVSPRHLRATLHQSRPAVMPTEAEAGADLARRAGAGAMIGGTFSRSGAGIRVDVRVDDLVAGQGFSGSASGRDAFAVAEALATRIRTGLGFGTSAGTMPIAESLSPSIAACRLYTRGLVSGADQHWQESAALLAEAVAIDPGFAEAHRQLAMAYDVLGQSAARDQALRDAAAHADRLIERHRLLVGARLEADLRERSRLLDTLLTRYPDAKEAYPLATRLYEPTAGPIPNQDKLLAIHRASVDVFPTSAEAHNAYGHALLSALRLPEATREFEESARLAPREPELLESLGQAYVLLGEPSRAAEFYARAVDLEFPFASNGLAYALGMRGRFDDALAAAPSLELIRAALVSRMGQYKEAERILRSGIARAEAGDDMLAAAGLHEYLASLALERRDFPAVLTAVQATRDRLSRVPPGFAQNMAFISDTLAGLADLGSGRLEKAQALADRQGYTHRPSSPVDRLWHGVLKGELALVGGDPPAATAAFRGGELPDRGISLNVPGSVLTNNLILRDAAARAAQAGGDTAAAIEIYRRLLANGPPLKWVALYEPRYVLQLGRLLDAAGDHEGAREEYRRFLDLWKDADADLPELAEARRAVRRE